MLKRLVAILASTALLALLAMPQAQAKGPDQLAEYGAGSSATALVLSLLDQQLAVSQTTAAVGSSPEAAADGAALLLAGNPVPGAAPSRTPGGAATNEACPIQADLDEITQGALSALELEVACVTTSTSVTDGAPAAESTSDEVRIIITSPAGALVDPILGPVLENVGSVTDPIVEALAPLLGAIEDVSEIDVPSVLDQLTEALGDATFVLAEIVVAPTVSQASADDTAGVVAQAGSNGVTINVLPGIASSLAQLVNLVDLPDPSTGPLLQVKIGSANASVVRDPATGEVQPDASAAQLLSITADDDLGILQEITGQVTEGINGLAVSELSCDGGVLAPIVCVDLGAVSDLSAEELSDRYPTFGEGAAGKKASAASITVLSALTDALPVDAPGVLGLSIASAEAAAYAVPATPVTPPKTPDQDRSLPSTGGEVSLPLTLALLATAGMGLFLVRRTRPI